ncbi:capsular polysaccharide export protein, LipB/KpsS family [Burkholderia cenocepacia]|uniref:capsular polysaccharide export protein, LipB/KpsS family n=1 Tax=Burkholderia cenocepacia TaxID=95486 RepID=UPI002AB7E22C|nr:capsular biosynthesis protein [Burkholderia cenocepacia]
MSDSKAAFDLRSIVRGRRSLCWLSGRTSILWLDSLPGRIAARIAAALRADVQVAWSGPVATRHEFGMPALSWISVPVAASTPRAFSALLDRSLLDAQHDVDPDRTAELTTLMERVRDLHALDPLHRLPACPAALKTTSPRTKVLLIDEREVDPRCALTCRRRRVAFRTLIKTAIATHPDATFWLGRSSQQGRGAWLSSRARDLMPAGLNQLSERETLCATIDHVDCVYTVGAPEAMHALLSNVPVHVFGAPYYSGWGFTHDAQPSEPRRTRPTLAEFFGTSFVHHAHYLDPATHRPGTLAALLHSIAIQREVETRFDGLGPLAGIRFQWWKRPFATPFLAAGGHPLRWLRDAAKIGTHECAVIWGGRDTQDLADDVRRVRIEDGFLHSGGLGSDMSPPLSQVIDTRGLHFDASRPSDLTALLNEAVFDSTELARAAAIRQLIVANGLTKYNLGRRRPSWQVPAGRHVILVPGQVADDASIRLGTRIISTADDLLREVRKLRPNAWIVYKPHPDVLSGNRNGLVNADSLADIVDTDSDLISLIEVATEVHTLSSLSGFEALLRGKVVYTYGLPFYAGWGLTHDTLAPVPWRERTLTLDMLTAGALLRYPLYWDWRLRLFTTPERVIAELAPLAVRPLASVQDDHLRVARKALRWTRNIISHLVWRSHQRRTHLALRTGPPSAHHTKSVSE